MKLFNFIRSKPIELENKPSINISEENEQKYFITNLTKRITLVNTFYTNELYGAFMTEEV